MRNSETLFTFEFTNTRIMPLKEGNSNMYVGWQTFNPLGGECPHRCGYCSTQSFMRYPVIKSKYTGVLRLDDKAMSKSLGSGSKWFVCAQNDLFAETVPHEFIVKILNKCRVYDNNTFLFQTKNPSGFVPYLRIFPTDVVLCTTIETNRWYPSMGNAPSPHHRALAMSEIEGYTKQITIEPLHDFDLVELVNLIRLSGATQVAIGADSKRHNLPEAGKDKILALIGELQKFTIIDRKSNLERLLK